MMGLMTGSGDSADFAATAVPAAASESVLWLWRHRPPKFPESSVALPALALRVLSAESLIQTAESGLGSRLRLSSRQSVSQGQE